ncbi:hypothetical protein DRW07_08595 [Alteromonas sediminis]|uniref:Bacterial virulence factor lipase N-terminal domain-containing protein n=1 Tax=Alteromonas sediminis TaxID=2259342 RepID=A0A3N5Y1L8_9ALTE|nr:VolA/Pla-1 family phospholipase [Alteromonas sediminis]RPJ67562.1 hypothetical protein DRW07_08595 [Alteromonas sediminis]
MRKLLICTSVMAALGLTGCGGGGETIADIEASTPESVAFSRVAYDPANGVLSTPNNLLLSPNASGFFDFTLNLPAEDPTDRSDPFVAINALDGWATAHPFTFDVNTTNNVGLDGTSLAAGVRLFEATLGLDPSDPDCFPIQNPVAGCKLGDELALGEDFVLSLADSDTVAVIPLKPLKPAQSYFLVTTTGLKDNNGQEVQGSSTWELVREDINEKPLSTPSQLGLQELTNSHVNLLMGAGLEREEITYVSAFTTQSTGVVLNTIKQLMIGEFAARAGAGDPTAGEALPVIVARESSGAPNAMEALGLVTDEAVAGAVQVGISLLPPELEAVVPLIQATDFSALTTCDGLIGTSQGMLADTWGPLNDFAVGVAEGILEQAGAFCAADLYESTISLPYYSAIPTAENPLAPITNSWTSACDSGFVLAAAPASVLEMATPGPNAALCQQVGLNDLRVNGEMLDPERNLTKFSPVPQPQGGNNGFETLDVQITVPNDALVEKPAAGWPIAILMHGITSKKEDMLAMTGALSAAGIATIAIDQPIHGSRGFDINPVAPGDELNASTVSATHYMNLAYLLTARDNLRQSVSDLLGLRLGINALIDGTADQKIDIDTSNVSVVGVSLGAITGGNFAAVANTPMPGELGALDSFFAVKTAALESPGGGIPSFLLESPAFGPLIKSLLIGQTLEAEFNGFLANFYPDAGGQYTEDQRSAAVEPFLEVLTPEQRAGVQSLFSLFAFASQTVLESGDPINYASTLGQNTPTLQLTVVGDGTDMNKPDQVIPVSVAPPGSPLAGQLPLARQIGLQQVTSTLIGGADTVSGLTLFNQGAHASSLNPSASAAATVEMQTQIATYLKSQGTIIPITNTDVIAN